MEQPHQGPTAGTETTGALLHRILAAVEKDRRRGRLELTTAIVLSLATLASTWCGYQARQWGGVQSSSQAAADTQERQAAENTIVGLQIRTQDGLILLEYWSALRQGDTQTQQAILAHMRPNVRVALQASLDAGVLHDPSVAGPLQRPEYVLAEEVQSKVQRREAIRLNAAAAAAGQSAGAYVLLTLMFASVLFFGGIAGTFTERRVRIGLASVALILFGAAIVMLAGLPANVG